jgi:hypothetical protein
MIKYFGILMVKGMLNLVVVFIPDIRWTENNQALNLEKN